MEQKQFSVPLGPKPVRRRVFADVRHQQIYDQLRTMRPRPDVERYRGMGGTGNAYAVGYTSPDTPNRMFPRGSRSYVGWAAGVDNAREDASMTPSKGESH